MTCIHRRFGPVLVAVVLLWIGACAEDDHGAVDAGIDGGDADADTDGDTDIDTDTDTDTDTDVDSDTDSDADTDTDADTDADAAMDAGPDGGADAGSDAGVDAGGDGGSEDGPSCTGEWGTTYYVRADGGSSTQCTGLVDAPYPGSGTAQPCAFAHPFDALPPGGTPILAGGDRLIIADGSYEMGYGTATSGYPDCESAYTWDCLLPPIPDGLSADQPTCIVGAGWNDGCVAPPELYAVERPWAILDLTDADHVRVECLELTDHSGCVASHSGSLDCPSWDDYPHGDYGVTGIRAVDSSDVTLRNLDIHGLPHTGIHAGRLTDWTLEDVRISGNGWVGFDGDVDGADGNAGTLRFTRVEISWNGCGETYPAGEPDGCWAQTAGGYGDGLGTGSTGGDWIFEECEISHNTSDGLDLLYHDLGGTISIDRCRAEGNAGNQIKTRGATAISNTVVVGNCGFFDGQSFTYDVDNCRAAGNALSLDFHTATEISLVNSTVFSEGDCLVLIGSGCGSTANFVSRNNVFVGTTDFLQPFENTCFYYSECATLTFDHDYGVIDGTKHDDACPWGAHDVCEDPLLVGPLDGGVYGMRLDTGSPAIDNGLAVGALGLIPSVDFDGAARPLGGGVDRGAYEDH